MLRKLVALAVLCVAGMASIPAQAQSFSIVELPGGCGTGNITSNSLSYLTVDSGLKLCVNATATLGGFTATATGTPISVTTGGVSGTLPAGAEVVATNVGTTNGAYCALGASATTSSQYIAPNGGWFAFAVGASTQLTCITSTSTTTVNTTGGSGLPTGTGGGGGGSSANASVSATGSGVPASATYAGMNVSGNLTGLTGTANGLKVDGSAVTQPESIASGQVSSGAYSAGSIASGAIASGALASGSISNGASVAQGSTTDSPATLPASATAASQVAIEKAIANAVSSAIPAGTNLIGKVGIDQTTPGTTNGVQVNAALPAGTNLLGKIGIDQTTPGTTNAVSPGTLAGGATFVHGTTAAMTGTAATQIIAAVTSKVIYVTRIKCNNSSGTATLVQITDGSAGTVLDTLAAGATYGGEQGTGPTPLFWTTSGNGLFAQDVTTSASVICTASGYSG